MEPGAVAAPILVDLGEDDGAAVRGPHRRTDADLGDGLDVPAANKVADAQLEPLRTAVVDHRRGVAAVGADLERAQSEIVLAGGLGGLVEDHLLGDAAGEERPAAPGPVLRARAERPPIEPVADADRDRAVVLRDPAAHRL